MGLLKHFLFPCLAIINGMLAIQIHFLDDKISVVNIWLEGTEAGEPYKNGSLELTTVESHAISAVGAFNAAFAFGFVLGIMREDSYFRGVMLWMQTINYVLDSIDAFKRELNAGLLYMLTLVCVIGLIVHHSEPGIFTNDKKPTTTKRNK